MKKSVLTLLTAILVVTFGAAQQVAIDTKEEMKTQMAIHLPMEIDINVDLPINLNIDIPLEMDLNFPVEFGFNFENGLFNGIGLNRMTPHFEEWDLNKAEVDPRKENIRIILGKDEYKADTELIIKNINGDVKVTGYDGDEIKIEGTKELWKKRGDISDEESSEYSVLTKMYEGKLYVYVESPESHVEFRKGKMDYHWHWDDNDRNRINAHFDLEIMVPKKLALQASTVNSGDVSISKMENTVKANNVNGSVTVKDVHGYATANTVNGDIEVWFLESPKENVDFQTVNGKIEIYSPKDLSAVVTFESLHGELYTDFEQVKRLPNRLNKEKDGDGFRYRINKTSPIQIGDGKIEMGFKMVNGDAYIRTRKS